MDGLVKEFLDITSAKNWLEDHNLDWIINDQTVGFVGIILGAALVYYVGWFIIKRSIRHGIRSTAKYRSWHRRDMEKRETTLIGLAKTVWSIIIVGYAAALIGSRTFGLDLSPLFASAGIIGVALGFGSQSLIKDFLSGIFIIAENQYRVGDVVDIMGSSGTVEKVGTRSTVIRDVDGNVHYIPNGTIQLVINKTMGYSMSRFALDISPDSDIARVTEIINNIGEKISKETAWKKKIIEPSKFVSVGEITGQYIQIVVSGKTMPSDQWSVTAEMRSRLLKAFDKEGIKLATLPTPFVSKR